jgi:hypothetical protein
MFSRLDPTSKRKLIFDTRATLLVALLCCALGGICSAAPLSLPGSAATEDKGDFKVVYGKIKDTKKHGHLEKLLKNSKLFDGIVADLNKTLNLPVDVPIQFWECTQLPDTKETGVENAWYDPDDNGITICYELIAKTETLFKDDETSADELEEAVLGATAWTFFHELGHALVDIYQLPITGKEEDAVDQLSTYILINGGDAGETAALDGAREFFKEQEEDGDLDDTQLADSHSLSKQRFFNIVCWIYGQNEKKFAELAKGDDAILPENRADGCKSEFEQITRSWTTLLAPHTKK